MTGGHGQGRAYSHINALDSFHYNSHIKGNCVVKACCAHILIWFTIVLLAKQPPTQLGLGSCFICFVQALIGRLCSSFCLFFTSFIFLSIFLFSAPIFLKYYASQETHFFNSPYNQSPFHRLCTGHSNLIGSHDQSLHAILSLVLTLNNSQTSLLSF